jgi:predicted DNA-binding transcriptional regulator AlpA
MTKVTLTQDIPSTGFVRLPQILNVIPISKSSWYRWVKTGRAPAGLKIGEKTTVWRAQDIQALIDDLGQQAA